jgi:hypothetical protein
VRFERENKERVVTMLGCVVGWWCGAAFAVAEGTGKQQSGRSDPRLQRDFHMTTEVTAWKACERVKSVVRMKLTLSLRVT